jgi:anaerobic magnesium-protoporphyrin IX monomethyl ester cyclase
VTSVNPKSHVAERDDATTPAPHEILLVYPPVLPFGYTLHHRFQRLWEIADYLRRSHPDLRVIDAGLLNTLQGDILREVDGGVKLLIFYVEPQLLETVAALMRRLRLMWPQLLIALYGPATTTYLGDVQALQPDAIGMRGDFEQQLTEILRWIDSSEEPRLHSSILRDGEWSEPAGDFRFLLPAEWGWPPLEDMPQSDLARIYGYKGQPTTMAVTVARGCPFTCAFCSTPYVEGRAERRRSAESLVEYLASHPEVVRWQMYAPNFTLNRRWVMRFCELVAERGLVISWKCTTRADRIDPEMARAMADAGCFAVGLGVETIGASRATISKGESVDVVAEAIRTLVAVGISVKAYVLLGLPGQSLDEVHATLDYVRSLGAQPRPTLYSPQGDADELVKSGLVSAPTTSVGVDRKSYLPEDTDGYGELLRLIYQR